MFFNNKLTNLSLKSLTAYGIQFYTITAKIWSTLQTWWLFPMSWNSVVFRFPRYMRNYTGGPGTINSSKCQGIFALIANIYKSNSVTDFLSNRTIIISHLFVVCLKYISRKLIKANDLLQTFCSQMHDHSGRLIPHGGIWWEDTSFLV